MIEIKEEFNKKNRVLIVAVCKDNNPENYDFEYDLKELENLVNACDMEVVDRVTQNLSIFNPKTYVGSGKIEEIRMIKDSLDVDTIVTNDELSPVQIESLEKSLEVTVFDRTYIILEIFRRRANTKEAKLQVEIASLKYMLPRLVGLRKGLSRQGSGKNKGQGEKQLELDRRLIESRISFLYKELKELTEERKFQRIKRKRNNMLIASLVGYTNSGKSSTLNAIVRNQDKQVFEKDMLFATLETSTRHVKLDNNLEFLLTDTVGFVNKLPHTLVEAFKSTLEEINESDLIIHVIDSSNDHYPEQIKITNEVINEIGANNIPVLYAFNKIDKVEGYFYVPNQYDPAIKYSAKDERINDLINKVEEMLFSSFHNVTFKIPYDKSNLLNTINNSSKVLSTKYEDYIYIDAYVSDYLFNYLNEYIVK